MSADEQTPQADPTPAAKAEKAQPPAARRAKPHARFNRAVGGRAITLVADKDGIVRPADDTEAAVADAFGLAVAASPKKES